MSEFKGTQGEFTHDVIESCSGDVFVSVLDAEGVSIAFCGKDKIAVANAQLFSAAPELFEALQDALQTYDKHGEHAEWDFARAAIAKALGESK